MALNMALASLMRDLPSRFPSRRLLKYAMKYASENVRLNPGSVFNCFSVLIIVKESVLEADVNCILKYDEEEWREMGESKLEA